MRFVLTLVAAALALVATAAPAQMGIDFGEHPDSTITSEDPRFPIKHARMAEAVLLDDRGIWTDAEWYRQSSDQVFGYATRTPRKQLSAGDLDRLKTWLLDTTNWTTFEHQYPIQGAAAVFLCGPCCAVTVMLELKCPRAHVRDELGARCSMGYGQVYPIGKELCAMLQRYFPDDAYLRERIVSER